MGLARTGVAFGTLSACDLQALAAPELPGLHTEAVTRFWQTDARSTYVPANQPGDEEFDDTVVRRIGGNQKDLIAFDPLASPVLDELFAL